MTKEEIIRRFGINPEGGIDPQDVADLWTEAFAAMSVAYGQLEAGDVPGTLAILERAIKNLTADSEKAARPETE